jgi:hypothetical protein
MESAGPLHSRSLSCRRANVSCLNPCVNYRTRWSPPQPVGRCHSRFRFTHQAPFVRTRPHHADPERAEHPRPRQEDYTLHRAGWTRTTPRLSPPPTTHAPPPRRCSSRTATRRRTRRRPSAWRLTTCNPRATTTRRRRPRPSTPRRPPAAAQPGGEPWMREPAIEEEGLLVDDDDGYRPGSGIPKRWRYGMGFLGAFLALFFFFALILWGASHNQRPAVTMHVRARQDSSFLD